MTTPISDATADEVKDALRACESIQSVNACAVQYAQSVVRMQKGSRVDKIMAIQIKNLAAYRRKMLREHDA